MSSCSTRSARDRRVSASALPGWPRAWPSRASASRLAAFERVLPLFSRASASWEAISREPVSREAASRVAASREAGAVAGPVSLAGDSRGSRPGPALGLSMGVAGREGKFAEPPPIGRMPPPLPPPPLPPLPRPSLHAPAVPASRPKISTVRASEFSASMPHLRCGSCRVCQQVCPATCVSSRPASASGRLAPGRGPTKQLPSAPSASSCGPREKTASWLPSPISRSAFLVFIQRQP